MSLRLQRRDRFLAVNHYLLFSILLRRRQPRDPLHRRLPELSVELPHLRLEPAEEALLTFANDRVYDQGGVARAWRVDYRSP